MCRDKHIRFSFIATVLALIIFSGCRVTIDTKEFTSKEPVTDPDIKIEKYVPAKAWNSTTLLADNHRRERPRIIEVDMEGKIVWEYEIPLSLRQYTNPGFDVEPLPNSHVLFVLPGSGIYEIDRQGSVVWSHLDPKVSHDVDRLPNGNTLYVYGNNDTKADPQVKEPIVPATPSSGSLHSRVRSPLRKSEVHTVCSTRYPTASPAGDQNREAVSTPSFSGISRSVPCARSRTHSRSFRMKASIDPSGEIVGSMTP